MREKWFLKGVKNQKGATIVLVAISLVALVGFAALAIDVGYIYAARNELQNVADASALAAARRLGRDYQPISYDEQQAYVCDKTSLVAAAQEVALKNQAAGKSIVIDSDDVLVGKWSEWKALPAGTAKAENLNQPDAVHVTARRDNLANGPVSTFFARVLGVETVNATASATAALTGKSTAAPGEIQIPVGIASYWFTHNSCNDHIKFSPTNDPDACAGWNSFNYTPSNDNRIRQILQENPSYISPRTTAGDTVFDFIGGDLSTNTFNAMLDLYQKYGYDVDANGDPILGADGKPLSNANGNPAAVPLYDDDGTRLLYNDGTPRNEHHWPTYVVVYDLDDCSNPNADIQVVGFAQINMTDVLGPPDKLLEGVVLCDYIDPNDNRGGGGEYGVKGPIPGLVE